MRFLFLLATASLWAAPTAEIHGSTQTQAVLAIRGYSGPCTIAVSPDPSYSPLIADFDGTEYTGASTDTGRADTITQTDGTRLVTIGHQDHDRALMAATAYYVRVTGCGGTVALSFSTPTLGTGSSQQWPAPFDATQKWNYGYPQVNLTSPAFVTDPLTGVSLKPVNGAGNRSWRTGGGVNPPVAGVTAFQDWAGGTGWTNPAHILNADTSDASTTNTNAIDLYGVYSRFTFGNADGAFLGISFDDLGIPIWASTSGSSNLSMCIFTSPVAGCLGTPVGVTPTGSFAKVASASSDPDGSWPNNFPTPFFSGWGLTLPLGPDHVNTQGALIGCTAGICTLAPSSSNFFPNTMAVGQKIFIGGTDPTCTNNLCTLASFQNAGQITVSEVVTTGAVVYRVYMWGLRITRTAGTGTLRVGAAFKHAGSLPIGQADARSWVCNPHGFTSGDGHAGFLCVAPSATNGNTSGSPLYFISGDGTIRSVWNGNVFTSAGCYASSNVADLPISYSGGGIFYLQQPVADSTDAKTFYVSYPNGTGTSSSLFKLVYSGDATEDFSTGYTYAQSGQGPIIASSPCGHWAATNLMPPSVSLDVVAQIAAYSGWSSLFTTLYGNSISSWSFVGITGGSAFYQNTYGGQNNPAWIAQFNLTTGLLTNMIHTFDGTGTATYDNSGIRWGGLHSLTPNLFTPALLIVSDQVGYLNSTALFSGPFQASPIGVLDIDGVTYKSNTSLPWPPDSTYFRNCPGGNVYEFMGATGTNCVTFKFPTGGVCNVNAQALERANFPACPWNASYTAPLALAVGDNFTDLIKNGGISDTGDSEHFRIISVSTISGGLKVVAQRNAIFDYCSFNPTLFPGSTVNNSGNSPGYSVPFTHASPWTAVMNPARLNGCAVGNFFLNPTSGAIVENGRLLQGHGDLTAGITPGNVSWIASGVSIPNKPYSSIFALPTVYNILAGPLFQGQSLNIGSGAVQSYVQTPGLVPWMVDLNALNGNFGTGPEGVSNSIGSVTLTRITGDVYTLNCICNGLTMSKLNYKTFPLLGWAGRYLLHDVSSPTAGVIDSSPWGICYAYNSGECHAGSAANTIYVNVPGAYSSGSCNTGQSFLIAPCVTLGYPGGGGVRQQRITSGDATGQGSRFLSYLLTTPGILYPYSAAQVSPDGSFAVASAHHTQGWSTVAWMLQLPPWQEDSNNRTQFGGATVQIPAGAPYAEVQFGYSRFIGANASPSLMYCTSRAEACNTSGSPYGFTSDTRTLTACTVGCIIPLPVAAPNLVYYRVGRSNDGVTWNYQDINILPLF